MDGKQGRVTVKARRDDATQGIRSAVKGAQAHSGRAVEVQLAEQNATAQYRVGSAGNLIGWFG
jgi:hypothetical protein